MPHCSAPSDARIDIVYLWVNGNDPQWRAKRHQAAQRHEAIDHHSMALYGNVEGRFRDNDELRYSLRALERYFPDHGHVYLITDGQTPSWLKPSSRLTLVDHRDLIPARQLPTFDSAHIESYVHRIPGLSERFFYFNDDVFFGAPVQLDHWFWPGGVVAQWSDDPVVEGTALRCDDNALENASRLSAQWLDRLPGYTHTPRTFAHSPRPLLKSLLCAAEAEAPELFARVRSTVFRTWASPTLVSDFVLRWALARGVARIREGAHQHVTTGCSDQAQQLDALLASAGELDFFCVNDTTDDAHGHDPRLAKVRAALQTLFPLASRFENDPAGLGHAPPHAPHAPHRHLSRPRSSHQLA
ncbi:MAG: exopolysaccharide phosphotransferase [Burkholderiales bacterium]|nr:MAG: exopolysaccharide phosphotransferase [Burkholderiales bacterium]